MFSSILVKLILPFPINLNSSQSIQLVPAIITSPVSSGMSLTLLSNLNAENIFSSNTEKFDLIDPLGLQLYEVYDERLGRMLEDIDKIKRSLDKLIDKYCNKLSYDDMDLSCILRIN